MTAKSRLAAVLALLTLSGGCRTAPAPASGETPSEVLAYFIAAADRGDFHRAYQLLSEEWRARYTPDRLKQDFLDEPLAKERLERARSALVQRPAIRGEVAEFPIGDGKAVRLVRERGAFRVAALE